MSLKHELLQTAATLGLPSARFHAVGITEWESVMKKIEDRFVSTQYDKVLWWWNGYFKGPVHATVLTDYPFELLDKLIPIHEQVWFITEDDRFWLFEGDITSIQQVLGDSSAFEYYVVSKKYEWLLCENHHGVLYGVGESIIEKIKLLEEQTRS